MKKEFSKSEAKKKINTFFKEIKNKTPKEIKKIKKLAMTYKIPLKNHRKDFCKKFLFPHVIPKIRIKKSIKFILCENCGYVSRFRLKK